MPDRFFVLDGKCHTVPSDQAAQWDNSPISLVLDDGSIPTLHSPHDFRRHYLDQNSQRRVKVSRAVLEMGKLPYPELRNIKHREGGKVVSSFDPMDAWLGHGLIARYFTPEELIQRGIINLHPSFKISNKFEVDYQAIEAIKRGKPRAKDNTGIHPLFKFTPSRWQDTSDLMYEYLKPSLHIATKILDMEVVLDFLTALGKPWVEAEPTPLHKAKSGQKQYSFYPKPLTSAEREATVIELSRMQDHVDFGWTDSMHPHVSGATGAKLVKPWYSSQLRWVEGLRAYKGSYSATIELNIEWKKYLDLDNLPGNSFVPNTDSRSRLLRTQFTLALVIVHELVHAWCTNTRRDPPGYGVVEPYCNDARIAEVGWGLQNAIFGSVNLRIADNPAMYDAPFGLSSIRFPGVRHQSHTPFGIESYKGTPAKWGFDIFTEYAIPMDFVGQFFTEEFWDTRLERFGSGMIRFPKPFGVRRARDWKEHSFDPLESPRVKRKLVDGVEVDDPEPRSPVDDTLHPGVREGVLLPNRATDGMGRRLDLNSGKVMKKRKTTRRALGLLSPIPEARSPTSPEDVSMPDAPSFGQGYGGPLPPARSIDQAYSGFLPPSLSIGQARGDQTMENYKGLDSLLFFHHADGYGDPQQTHRNNPDSRKPLPPPLKQEYSETIAGPEYSHPKSPKYDEEQPEDYTEHPDYSKLELRPVTDRDMFKFTMNQVKEVVKKKADRNIAKVKSKTKDVGAMTKGVFAPTKFKDLFMQKRDPHDESHEPLLNPEHSSKYR